MAVRKYSIPEILDKKFDLRDREDELL